MGDSADEAVPALMRSLQHINSLVRGNAAESLGKMGPAAVRARRALEKRAGMRTGAFAARPSVPWERLARQV